MMMKSKDVVVCFGANSGFRIMTYSQSVKRSLKMLPYSFGADQPHWKNRTEHERLHEIASHVFLLAHDPDWKKSKTNMLDMLAEIMRIDGMTPDIVGDAFGIQGFLSASVFNGMRDN